MVKKKYTSSRAKNNTSKSASKPRGNRPARMKWYVWILLGLLLVVVGNMIYKYVSTKRDVALLDQAEAKMRQIEFPDGQKGVIERYCSERSVKFGSAGKPTCGVSTSIEISGSQSISNKNTDQIIESINAAGSSVEAYRDDESRAYYNLPEFSEGLYCYLGDVLPLSSQNDPSSQNITIYCQKEFQSKVYPIRN
jgi:hypothetical protein